jgi:hypothetical protein
MRVGGPHPQNGHSGAPLRGEPGFKNGLASTTAASGFRVPPCGGSGMTKLMARTPRRPTGTLAR